MHDFVRGTLPWGKLLRLASRLPRTSRYMEAVLQDDELAMHRPAQTEASKQVPLREWSYEVELLTLLVDMVQGLRADFIASKVKNNKRPKVDTLPRPRTAVDRASQRADIAQHRDIVRQVMNRKDG